MFMSHGPSINSKYVAIFRDYRAADEFLGDKNSYRFNRQAGYLERNSGRIGLRYHDTEVVSLYPNGDTSFNTGGWFTPSTQKWMDANTNFDVHLYEPRSGERKPFRYSTIRFAGHDRNIERKLREEWGMPTFAEMSHIWYDSFREYRKLADPGYGELGVTHEYRLTDPFLHERAQYFRDELVRRQVRRHPTYVFENGITFTKRGRCPRGTLLRDAIKVERRVREAEQAERRKVFGTARAYTNTLMESLQRGMLLDGALPTGTDEIKALVHAREPNAPLVLTFVGQKLPGDARHWLNLHAEGEDLVIGHLPPLVEPMVRKRLYEAVKEAILV